MGPYEWALFCVPIVFAIFLLIVIVPALDPPDKGR